MKKLLFTLSILLLVLKSFGQFEFSFEYPEWVQYIYRDTLSNPACTWQVGQPGKTLFDSAYSYPNALITDTINPVPANDTSAFFLLCPWDKNMAHHSFSLEFWFQLDGDTTDYGMIEVSPDNGVNWINLLTEGHTYNLDWSQPKPTLQGSTGGWKYFNVNLVYWAINMNGTYPILMTADTIIFRFTYITDSNATPRAGWMIDNLSHQDWALGIENTISKPLRVFPNPANNDVTVELPFSDSNSTFEIFDITGRPVYTKTFEGGFTNAKFTIKLEKEASGIYFYTYREKGVAKETGKITVIR